MISSAGSGGHLRDGLRIALSPAQLAAVFDAGTVGSEGGASDGAVPIASATLAGAVRVATVRAGHIALMKHEARSADMLGAGKDGSTRFTSTFTDLLTAERALTLALRIRRSAIANWSRTAPRGRVFTFEFNIGRVIGQGVSNGGHGIPMARIKIGLHKETYNGNPYFIVVSRPLA
jgi:hypothetical protein